MAQVLTTAYSYGMPARPRITFTSLDGTDTYFTFNAYNSPANDLNLVYCDAERAAGETGSFNIVIQDVNNVVEKDHLRNARVLMEFGKTTTTFKPFFIGFADIFQTRRPRSFYQEYLLTGPSSKIQAAELMLLIRKATNKARNPNYGIGNLVIDMATKHKSRPLNTDDIEEITGWVIDLVSNGGGIADETNAIFLPVINEVFSTYWDFLERMSAISGAPWDIDYDAAWNETLTMKYPIASHSGITVKSGDLKTAFDNAAKVSYITDAFTIEDNATFDAGVATRLYTTTVIDQQVISSQNTNGGFANLTSVARAQQIVIENDQRRITDLAFILSKTGDPKSSKDRINGDLVMDLGDNTPRGRVLATFNIPLGDIKTTPDTIFVNDVDVKVRFLQGENKVWLRLFQRSGLDGDPNVDTVNQIRWHHNGIFNTTQAVYTANSTGPSAGDYKLKDTMTWASDNKGPIFCYSIFSKINRLLARSNPSQAKVIRWKEQFLDSSFLKDPASVNRLLSLTLKNKSKARRTIQDFRVTIPDNYLFKPYHWISFNDGLSNENQDLQVQRSRIVVSALPGEGSGLGALEQEITLGGNFNPLIGNCSCG